MNDLQKRFEEETGLPLTLSLETEDSIFFYDNPAYVTWLQEQLTWKSAEEPPEVPGVYLIMWNDIVLPSYYYQTAINKENRWLQFNSSNTYKNVTHWLPIPKLND